MPLTVDVTFDVEIRYGVDVPLWRVRLGAWIVGLGARVLSNAASVEILRDDSAEATVPQ